MFYDFRRAVITFIKGIHKIRVFPLDNKFVFVEDDKMDEARVHNTPDSTRAMEKIQGKGFKESEEE